LVRFQNIGWGAAQDAQINQNDLSALPVFRQTIPMAECQPGESVDVFIEAQTAVEVPHTVRVHWSVDQVQHVPTDQWRALMWDHADWFFSPQACDELEVSE